MEKKDYEKIVRNLPDHNSKKFLIFLMNNNTVADDLTHWLIIENYKYHTPDKVWYTAFLKRATITMSQALGELHEWAGDGMAIFQNPLHRRSIGRTHYHITPFETPEV